MASKDWIVGGFQFGSQRDAELAQQEEKKIAYMESKMRYDKPEAVLGIYNKVIEQRVFETPVGFKYLQSLNAFLQEKGLGDEAKSIPLYNVYSRDTKEEFKTRVAERRVQPTRYSMLRAQLRLSVWINIFLIILVIAMFVITLKSSNPNILNYEKALQNKYASWDEELKQKEAELRERERALNREQTADKVQDD